MRRQWLGEYRPMELVRRPLALRARTMLAPLARRLHRLLGKSRRRSTFAPSTLVLYPLRLQDHLLAIRVPLNFWFHMQPLIDRKTHLCLASFHLVGPVTRRS